MTEKLKLIMLLYLIRMPGMSQRPYILLLFFFLKRYEIKSNIFATQKSRM